MPSLRDTDVFASVALMAEVRQAKQAAWMGSGFRANPNANAMAVAHENHFASKPPLRALNVGSEIRQLIRAHAFKVDLAKVFETE